MATHSSTLAWEIPWTEKPGELVHEVTRVRHDLLAHVRENCRVQDFYSEDVNFMFDLKLRRHQ